MKKNFFGLANKCKVTLKDIEGNVLSSHYYTNTTCKIGRTNLLKRLINFTNTAGTGVANYMEIGTGNTIATDNDTALQTPVNRTAMNINSCFQVDNKVTLICNFGPSLNYTVREVGVFVGETATSTIGTGALLCRTILTTPIALGTANVLTVQWEIQLNNIII